MAQLTARRKMFIIIGLVACMFELCPPMLYEVGLNAALEWLVRNKQPEGIVCEFSAADTLAHVDNHARYFLFVAAQELLANALKHSQAQRVRLTTNMEDGNIILCVEDNGAGISVDSASAGRSQGFGLFNIRERARHFGGRFEITSSAGHGSIFRLIVPVVQPFETEGNT